MPSGQSWSQFISTTESNPVTVLAWKAVSDSSTIYSANPITAGNASYNVYQALKFTGSWNSLSAFTYIVDANGTANIGAGLTINGTTTSIAANPVSTANNPVNSMSSTVGIAANFASSTSPFFAGTTSTTGAPGGTMYVQCLLTQLETSTAALPGDIAARTITASWTES